MLQSLDDETSAELVDILQDKTISTLRILTLCEKHKWQVSEFQLKKHRAGSCKCR